MQACVLMVVDYEFFGNNIAAGQFHAQVWGPVCNDPSADEAMERRDINYNWAATK